MIPLLLWRCPLCATDDALEHHRRCLRADLVRCRACRAEWRLRRVPGDDFYLKLIRDGYGRGGASVPAPVSVPAARGATTEGSPLHDERSVAAWYDAMKATVRLAPIHAAALALQPGETLYLASGPAELQAEETDPLFFPALAPNSPMRQAENRTMRSGIEASAGFFGPSKRPAKASISEGIPYIHNTDKRAVHGRAVGAGRLFLTDRRLAWQGEAACDFSLARLNSAYALMADGLVLMVEMRLYTVRFLRESLLKWVTFIALVAPQVEAATGHRIATSHF